MMGILGTVLVILFLVGMALFSIAAFIIANTMNEIDRSTRRMEDDDDF